MVDPLARPPSMPKILLLALCRRRRSSCSSSVYMVDPLARPPSMPQILLLALYRCRRFSCSSTVNTEDSVARPPSMYLQLSRLTSISISSKISHLKIPTNRHKSSIQTIWVLREIRMFQSELGSSGCTRLNSMYLEFEQQKVHTPWSSLTLSSRQYLRFLRCLLELDEVPRCRRWPTVPLSKVPPVEVADLLSAVWKTLDEAASRCRFFPRWRGWMSDQQRRWYCRLCTWPAVRWVDDLPLSRQWHLQLFTIFILFYWTTIKHNYRLLISMGKKIIVSRTKAKSAYM